MSKSNQFVDSFAAAIQSAANLTIEGEGSDKKAVVKFDLATVADEIDAVEGQSTLAEIKTAQETQANIAAAIVRATHLASIEKLREDKEISGVNSSTKIGNDTVDVGIKRHTQAVNPQDTSKKIDVYGSTSVRVTTAIASKRQPVSTEIKAIKSTYVDSFAQ